MSCSCAGAVVRVSSSLSLYVGSIPLSSDSVDFKSDIHGFSV